MYLADSVEDEDVVPDIVTIFKARCSWEENERNIWSGWSLRLSYGIECLAYYFARPAAASGLLPPTYPSI